MCIRDRLGIEGDISIPSKQKILEKALEAKVLSNVMKIHELVTLLHSDEPMDKGIRNALAGAAEGAAMAMSPAQAKPPQQIKPPVEVRAPASIPPQQVEAPQQVEIPKASAEQVYANVAKQYPLLGAIGQKESSGGKNLHHATMMSGPNKGHTAGG